MQAPGGPEEDRSGGFARGGWSVGYWDDTLKSVMDESMSGPFDLVLGRKTYEIFAAYWPPVDAPYAEPLNTATKHVASTTLSELGWQNSRLIEGDVPDGISALKAQDGPEIQVHGSANLIQTLLEHGLVVLLAGAGVDVSRSARPGGPSAYALLRTPRRRPSASRCPSSPTGARQRRITLDHRPVSTCCRGAVKGAEAYRVRRRGMQAA